MHPIELTGRVDTPNKNLTLGLNAPYIIQKKKVIEGTNLALSVDNRTKMTTLNLSTKLDNKNGDIILLLNGLAATTALTQTLNGCMTAKKTSLAKSACPPCCDDKKTPSNWKRHQHKPIEIRGQRHSLGH